MPWLLRVPACGVWRGSYPRVLGDGAGPGACGGRGAADSASLRSASARPGSFKPQAAGIPTPSTHLTLPLPGREGSGERHPRV